MELRQVRYFVEFAATGSFSDAARRLHITQPAISRQVKLLEEELGVTLVRREGNAASLTREGEVFFDEARDLLDHAERVMVRVRGLRGEVLRVGYISSLVAAIMPRVLARFRAMGRKVRVELIDLTPAEVREAAARQEIEVAIVPRGLEESLEGFGLIDIWNQQPVLVMRRGHPLARRRKIDPAALAGLPLLGLGRTDFPEYAPRLRAILQPHGVRPRLVRQTADGMPSLFADLVAEDGLAVLTEGIEHSLPPGLVTRRFDPPLAGLTIFAGVSTVRPNAHAQAFIRLLEEEGRAVGKTRRP